MQRREAARSPLEAFAAALFVGWKKIVGKIYFRLLTFTLKAKKTRLSNKLCIVDGTHRLPRSPKGPRVKDGGPFISMKLPTQCMHRKSPRLLHSWACKAFVVVSILFGQTELFWRTSGCSQSGRAETQQHVRRCDITFGIIFCPFFYGLHLFSFFLFFLNTVVR